MRVSIAAVGRMKAGPERELVARYLERAAGGGRPLALTGFGVIELTESRSSSSASRKSDEANALGAALPEGVAARAAAGNAPALAGALLPLIESAPIRQDYGARARAYGDDMGSWKDMATATMGIYRTVLAARA